MTKPLSCVSKHVLWQISHKLSSIVMVANSQFRLVCLTLEAVRKMVLMLRTMLLSLIS